jgi:hypothetical protein
MLLQRNAVCGCHHEPSSLPVVMRAAAAPRFRALPLAGGGVGERDVLCGCSAVGTAAQLCSCRLPARPPAAQSLTMLAQANAGTMCRHVWAFLCAHHAYGMHTDLYTILQGVVHVCCMPLPAGASPIQGGVCHMEGKDVSWWSGLW